MCGIIGYTGKKTAGPILLNGLKRLEYRGYDSSGIATNYNNHIEIAKTKGKLHSLSDLLYENPLKGNCGIGHTRWATHGKPNDINAHPHANTDKTWVIVHNGIIENYRKLKGDLIDKGYKFVSDTDTEVIVHLLSENETDNILDTLYKTASQLEGTYALGILNKNYPDTIFGMRRGSPLLLGLGEEEMLIASDIPAVLDYTRDYVILDDDQFFQISPDTYKVYDKDLNELKPEITHIKWDPIMAEKGGYKHFMLKEIFEQPVVVENTLRGRINYNNWNIELDEVNIPISYIKKLKRIYIVACGTSWHAGLIGKFLLEDLLHIPVEVDYGSEFRYRKPPLVKDSLFISISQSGETADTLAGLRYCEEKGIRTFAICNVISSSIARLSDDVLYTRAGPEIGVASTKAFTAQLTAIFLLGLYFASMKGTLEDCLLKDYIKELMEIPNKIRMILKKENEIEIISKKYFKKNNFLYIGRGINYPIALEGALKLKEISYIHAEGYPAGEMKHGPIALIDDSMPVVAIASKSPVYEKILSNIEEVKAREGKVISVVNEDASEIIEQSNDTIIVPATIEYYSTILNVIPLQLFSYYIALRLGCDIDQPRNLAKSVTVE